MQYSPPHGEVRILRYRMPDIMPLQNYSILSHFHFIHFRGGAAPDELSIVFCCYISVMYNRGGRPGILSITVTLPTQWVRLPTQWLYVFFFTEWFCVPAE